MEATTTTATDIALFTALAAAATSERACEMHRDCARNLYRSIEWTDADTAEVREAWGEFLRVEFDLIISWGHRAIAEQHTI